MAIPESSLPFSIGSEVELQIVNAGGEILRGEELISVWNAIFEKIEGSFRKRLKEIPAEFQGKVKDIKHTVKSRQGKQLPYIEVVYKTLGKEFNINVIGPDPNISQVTWLMELVTPPCTSIHEFTTWQLLLNTSLLDSLPSGFFVFPLGLNPLEKEYSSGVTFGEHYHIGIGSESPETALAMYHMIRNYVPHLIALTTNSPFMNKQPTGTVKVSETPTGMMILGKDCIKSLRLTYNKAQLGPVDKETYIPCMERLNKEKFCEIIRRKPPDDRFVDIYPFTNYGTIEVRFFDTQFSVARRAAIVAVLEAMCLKAKRLVEQGTTVPCVTSASIIGNREKAIAYGLHGRFSPDTHLIRSFSIIYNEDPVTGKQNGMLFHAIKSMLMFVKKEAIDLHIDTLLHLFVLSVSGNQHVRAPVGPADYLLYLLEKNNGDMARTCNQLKAFQRRYCSLENGTLPDPLIEEWGTPADNFLARMVPEKSIDATKEKAPRKDTTQEEKETYDFTSARAAVQDKLIEYGKPVPYRVDFNAQSPVEQRVKITVIQQLIEMVNKEESVLASSFTNVEITTNAPTSLTQETFPLSLRDDLFIGKKRCYLKFILKGERETSAYSDSFWLELVPRINLAMEFRKRKINFDDKVEIKYKIYIPNEIRLQKPLNVVARFQVLSIESHAILQEASEKVVLKGEEYVAFKIDGKVIENERGISLRMALYLNDNTVARHESGEILVEGKPPESVPKSDGLKMISEMKGIGSQPAPVKKLGMPATNQEGAGARAATGTKDLFGVVKKLEFTSTPVTSPGIGTSSPATPSKRVQQGHQPAIEPKKAVTTPDKNVQATPGKKERDKEVFNKVQDAATKMVQQARTSVARVTPGQSMPVNARQSVPATLPDLPYLNGMKTPDIKVEITHKQNTPVLIATDSKTAIQFTMRKIKDIPEAVLVKRVVFMVNGAGDVALVQVEKFKFLGSTRDVTVELEPLKQFKSWAPIPPFALVVQLYQEGQIMGQDVFDDFTPASFTTTSQITWKKIDVLSRTLYKDMYTAIELEFDVKPLLNPLMLQASITCQSQVFSNNFSVTSDGHHEILVPLKVPNTLTPVQSCTGKIAIMEHSTYPIKDQARNLSIIPSGPQFEIIDPRIEIFGDLDDATITFKLFNEDRPAGKCDVDVLAWHASGRYPIKLCSKSVKPTLNKAFAVEFTKVKLPLDIVRGSAVDLDFTFDLRDFNKVKHLIRKSTVIEGLSSPDEALVQGRVKTILPTRVLAPGTDKVPVEIEVFKNPNVPKIKVRLVPFREGIELRAVKEWTFSKGSRELRENVYWSPPETGEFPIFCKLELRIYHEDAKEHIDSPAVKTEPLHFLILPE